MVNEADARHAIVKAKGKIGLANATNATKGSEAAENIVMKYGQRQINKIVMTVFAVVVITGCTSAQTVSLDVAMRDLARAVGEFEKERKRMADELGHEYASYRSLYIDEMSATLDLAVIKEASIGNSETESFKLGSRFYSFSVGKKVEEKNKLVIRLKSLLAHPKGPDYVRDSDGGLGSNDFIRSLLGESRKSKAEERRE